ncbi:MAG: hypothetical protein U0Q15_12070 [Kineosporiaceae bacterium]
MSTPTPVVPTGPTVGVRAASPPGLGGLTSTFLAIEIRRLLRNRRMVIFSFVMPAGFYLLFGKGRQDAGDPAAARYALVSLALYAAMLTSTAAGATVSVERAQGWSRRARVVGVAGAGGGGGCGAARRAGARAGSTCG